MTEMLWLEAEKNLLWRLKGCVAQMLSFCGKANGGFPGQSFSNSFLSNDLHKFRGYRKKQM
jgi:hypothetical protein